MAHLGALLGVRVNAAERHQEDPLQRLGRRRLRKLRIHHLLGLAVTDQVLEPVHQVHLQADDQVLQFSPPAIAGTLGIRKSGKDHPTHLSWGPGVVNGDPPGDDLHDQHAEAVDVAPLGQHPRAGVLGSNVSAPSKQRTRLKPRKILEVKVENGGGGWRR